MLPARAFAIAALANHARPAQAKPGYRLYWMTGDLLGSRDVAARAGSPSPIVLGRHTHCDVILDADPTVALRHLLVSVVLHDGAPVLQVLDLRTQDGFELADGSPQRSIFVQGPVVFGVGAYSIVALPSGAPIPAAMPPLPPVAGNPYRVIQGWLADDPVARPDVRSRITILPRALDLEERVSRRGTGSPPQAFDGRGLGPAEPGSYELSLASASGRARVRLSPDDLERGVLVGRDPRCVDAGLRAVLSDDVSRVHILLMRVEGVLTAIDLASTQGTTHERRRVRTVTLERHETRLELAHRRPVELCFRT